MKLIQLFYKLLILESTIGITFCTANYGLNLLPLWLKTDCAIDNGNACFEWGAEMAMGFGYWAFYVAIVALTMIECRDIRTRRRLSRFSAPLYAIWWPLFYKSIFVFDHWRMWVLALYLPVRFLGFLGHSYFGYIAGDDVLEHPNGH